MISKANTISFKLGKDQRLKSRKLISSLFRDGRQISSFPIRVVYQFTAEHTGLKAGFTVSSRNFKKSVDRNRLKRLMREGYRLQKSELEAAAGSKFANLAIFFMYTGKEIESQQLVSARIKTVLAALTGIVNNEYQKK